MNPCFESRKKEHDKPNTPRNLTNSFQTNRPILPQFPILQSCHPPICSKQTNVQAPGPHLPLQEAAPANHWDRTHRSNLMAQHFKNLTCYMSKLSLMVSKCFKHTICHWFLVCLKPPKWHLHWSKSGPRPRSQGQSASDRDQSPTVRASLTKKGTESDNAIHLQILEDFSC